MIKITQFLKSGIVVLMPLILSTSACAQEKKVMADLGDGVFAVIDVADAKGKSKGEIVLKLEYQKTPMTVANFVGLAEGSLGTTPGKPFYDGLNFHRVIANFMIQGGDPKGNGTGGPGYQFPDEFDKSLRHNGPGILSMANSGPWTNGSQFFITHVATPHLDDKHTIFGHVVKGQDLVNAVAQGDKIKTIKIIRNGEAAQGFTVTAASFEKMREDFIEKLRTDAIAAIESKYPNAQKTASGIYYTITKQTNGPQPKAGQTVSLNYKLKLLNGTTIDDSSLRGEPIEFPVGTGYVIPGWDEMVMDMHLLEKRNVVIPPELGYGEHGAGQGAIPPYAFLDFEMELIKIK